MVDISDLKGDGRMVLVLVLVANICIFMLKIRFQNEGII
jgi:hypothetical protein